MAYHKLLALIPCSTRAFCVLTGSGDRRDGTRAIRVPPPKQVAARLQVLVFVGKFLDALQIFGAYLHLESGLSLFFCALLIY